MSVVELGEIEKDAREAAEAAGIDLSDFMREAVALKLRGNNFAVARSLSQYADAELVEQIQTNFTPDFWQHFIELRKKSSDDAITEVERQELIAFSNQVLTRDAERLPLLAELARRWNIPLLDLVQRFSFRPQDVL